jgi:flagellar L-ring protein precursor FlgH
MRTHFARLIASAAAGGLASITAGQETPPPVTPVYPPELPAVLTGPVEPAGPTSSLMAQAAPTMTSSHVSRPHALRAVSLFAVAPPEPPEYQLHDLVQIIVRESSAAASQHELETEKSYDLDAEISAWTDVRLDELLELQMRGARTTDLPAFDLSVQKDFEGEGDYKRKDDLSARLTAEVIEILPNGNLVLEARTYIKNDEEELTINVTGMCRPQDITLANTILSNQIHDLRIEKNHEGELKKANQKGIIAKVLDAIFAY